MEKETVGQNILYLQSGGPTAVINATAYGVISECADCLAPGEKLFAARHGILGVIRGERAAGQTSGNAFNGIRLHTV